MFPHYLKIAFRSLFRYGVYSFINIFGLSVGIAVSLIILLYVSHETSFDKFHTNQATIFRAYGKINWGGKEVNAMGLSPQFGPIVKQNDSHVLNYVRIISPGRKLVSVGNDRNFYENGFLFSDSSFFSVFSFPLIQGNNKGLGKPNTVIITESIARKYFKEENPIGKILTYDRIHELEIVSVAKDAPSNSTLTFDFIASIPTLEQMPDQKSQFTNNKVALGNAFTYLLLDNKESVANTGATIAKLAEASVDEKYILDPLSNLHVGTANSNDVNYVSLFLLIALLVLGLALINYMNLTTARASIRAKEVGLRKISGARRSSVAAQFYLESSLITLSAFILALIWLQTFLPAFLNLVQLKIDAQFVWQPAYLLVIAVLFIFCMLLSGSYPALVLSRFKPTEVIKGKLSSIGQGGWVRRFFTVFQFTASVALIICSLVVKFQLDFIHHVNIGLTKEQVMVVNLDPALAKHYRSLKNELKNKTGISQVAAATLPLYTSGTSAFFTQTPKTKEDVFINVMNVDESFFKTLGIQWAMKPDSILQNSIFVNQSGLDQLKITAADLPLAVDLGREKPILAGVVKDFNYESLRSKVNGLLISVAHDTSSVMAQLNGFIYLRMDQNTDLKKKVMEVEQVFKKYQPSNPFEYYFLDDAFDKLYKSEDRLANLFNLFTGIAIFIGCLGLFGLVSFTTQIKTKEIGIRKVLGASVLSIVKLLSKDFLLLLLISVLLATPVAYWSMQHWLNGFSYKMEIPWWFAVVAATMLGIVALVTIAVQTIKAAIGNPVDSLRSE